MSDFHKCVSSSGFPSFSKACHPLCLAVFRLASEKQESQERSWARTFNRDFLEDRKKLCLIKEKEIKQHKGKDWRFGVMDKVVHGHSSWNVIELTEQKKWNRWVPFTLIFMHFWDLLTVVLIMGLNGFKMGHELQVMSMYKKKKHDSFNIIELIPLLFTVWF